MPASESFKYLFACQCQLSHLRVVSKDLHGNVNQMKVSDKYCRPFEFESFLDVALFNDFHASCDALMYF